jgi:hypothetical protein
LQLTLADASKAASLANAIKDIDDVHDKFRLYNVDILPERASFYEHDVFSLARCKVDVLREGGNSNGYYMIMSDSQITTFQSSKLSVLTSY